MDQIFKALADPARRKILDALRNKDGQTLSELETLFEMSRFGVMKHLSVLEDAQLISTRKQGRFKYHYLNALPLQEAIDRWIEPLIAKPTARSVLELKKKLEGTQKMTKPDLVGYTFIKCSQDDLWAALTDTNTMEKWHFACTTIKGDIAEGETSEFYAPDGSKMIEQVTEKLDPKSRIEIEFRAFWAPGDPLIVKTHYIIEPQGDVCKLTYENYGVPEGLPGFAEGGARWAAGLKSYLETGVGLNG